ncbi:MAG: NAD-dependent epimerase/dehydratase family protein [Rhodospirillaceae bacterium]
MSSCNFDSGSVKVLVTGASGFFGSHICRTFQRNPGQLYPGLEVVASVRTGSDRRRLERLAAGVSIVVFDLLADRSEIEAVFERFQPEIVVHCAAYGVDYRERITELAIATNVGATAKLIEIAAKHGVGRFLHIGTCSAYGGGDELIDETAPLAPRGIYAATKAAGALIALERGAACGLPLLVIHPFSMYGPLEGIHKFVPMVMTHCLESRPLDLTSGEQKRDYIYVGDVAEACLMLATIDDFPAGEVINVGSGISVSLRSFGDAAARMVGNGEQWLRWGRLPRRPDDIGLLVADTGKLHRLTGWRPSTHPNDGLRQTFEHLAQPPSP